MSDILLGYVISIIIGIPVTFIWSEFLHGQLRKYRTEEDTEAERIRWIPTLIGIFERGVITTLIVSGLTLERGLRKW